MENSPKTLYQLIWKDYVRLSLTKNEKLKEELQNQINWMVRAVIRILESNKQ